MRTGAGRHKDRVRELQEAIAQLRMQLDAMQVGLAAMMCGYKFIFLIIIIHAKQCTHKHTAVQDRGGDQVRAAGGEGARRGHAARLRPGGGRGRGQSIPTTIMSRTQI